MKGNIIQNSMVDEIEAQIWHTFESQKEHDQQIMLNSLHIIPITYQIVGS